MTSSRWGFGLGGGGGLSVIVVFNSNGLWWLNGTNQSDWGVEISLGKKRSDVIKYMADKRIHTILKLILRNPAQFLHNLDNLRDFSHYLYNSLDVMNSKQQHPIVSLDVPFAGVGLELSAFVKNGKIWIDPENRRVFGAPGGTTPSKFPTRGRMAP